MVGLFSFIMLVTQSFSYNSVKKAKNLVSKLWYNFEGNGDEEWVVTTSRFGDPEETRQYFLPGVPEALGKAKDETEKSLAIQASFTSKGHNFVDVAIKDSKPFFGKVDNINVWVWGGNFDYNLEMHLEDRLNFVHRLPMANLKYYGWKNIVVKIPGTIKQLEPYAPRQSGFKFKKFRLYSEPYARKEKFICVFDYFKIVTDTYTDQFDGYDIEKMLLDMNDSANQTEGGNY